MPPALTFSHAFVSWTYDWPAIIVAAIALSAYVGAIRRIDWPVRRTIAFTSGIAVFLLCTCSFIATYDEVLFWTRALQNMLLLMGVPLLIAMGSPLRLIMETATPTWARRLRRIGHSRIAGVLTRPLSVTVMILAPLPILYLSGLYEATLRHDSIDLLVRIALLSAGFLYYWTRLGIDPTPRSTAHVISFAISFAETLVDGALGVILWLGPLVAHSYYLGIGRVGDPSIRQDQTMGAVALWFGGDAIGIPYLIVLFVQWIRDEGRKSRRIDAELDRKDAQLRHQSIGEQAGGPEPAEAMQSGLWWEANPELSRRYGLRAKDE